MKRLLIIVFVSILLSSATACAKQQSGDPIQLYYRTQKITHGVESGIIASETRYFSDIETLEEIITQYLSGPTSESLISPFPEGLTLQNLTLDSAKVQIVLSDHIASQSGIDLTVTCACIQNTVKELTGIDAVHISAENEKINNQDTIILSSSRVLLSDTEVSISEHSTNNP